MLDAVDAILVQDSSTSLNLRIVLSAWCFWFLESSKLLVLCSFPRCISVLIDCDFCVLVQDSLFLFAISEFCCSAWSSRFLDSGKLIGFLFLFLVRVFFFFWML